MSQTMPLCILFFFSKEAVSLCRGHPRSQGLSSSHPRKRERGDPGWGWSRVSQKKIRPREGSFACLSLSRFIVHSKKRLPLCCAQPTRNSFKRLKNTGELELYFSDANLALLMLSTILRLLISKRSYLARKE